MPGKTSETVLAYRDTIRYKMVFILGAYRLLMMFNGCGFLDNLKHHRASTCQQYNAITENAILLIDAGYTELDLKEVRLYSNYIAKALNYDENDFYNVLSLRAAKVKISDNDVERDAKERIRAMNWIDSQMKKINRHG